MVGLYGEAGGEGLAIGIVGPDGGLVGALGIPLEAAGELGSVVGKLGVGGVGGGTAADVYANGVSAFKSGFGYFGKNRRNANVEELHHGLLFFSAGGQHQKAGGQNHCFFHMLLKFIS